MGRRRGARTLISEARCHIRTDISSDVLSELIHMLRIQGPAYHTVHTAYAIAAELQTCTVSVLTFPSAQHPTCCASSSSRTRSPHCRRLHFGTCFNTSWTMERKDQNDSQLWQKESMDETSIQPTNVIEHLHFVNFMLHD